MGGLGGGMMGGMGGGMMGGMGGGMMGGMGGGIGDDMGGLGDMGAPDMGGAPPNISGAPPIPMESFNPAASTLTAGNPTKRKDLTRRNANERIATQRGMPEEQIVSSEDVSDTPGEAYDIAGLERTYTSPMGNNESTKFSFEKILLEYREMSKKNQTNLYESLVHKEMPWTKAQSRRGSQCTSISPGEISLFFGESSSNVKTVLTEGLNSFESETRDGNTLLEEAMEELEKRTEEILKTI
jgi:hypothetical protein